METLDKLKILGDSAKYDVSCSSSGSKRTTDGGIGNGEACGICHSFAADRKMYFFTQNSYDKYVYV